MMTHMTKDRRHFHCIRFCWKFNVNRDYRESILWKDRIRLLYNVILVDLDEDDILGSVWRLCLHSGTGFGLPDDIDVRILLQECVLQVLGFHLGGFPERGLGPDQLGLQLPREQVGRRRAGAGRGGHGNGDFSFGFHGEILDILITFWNMRQIKCTGSIKFWRTSACQPGRSDHFWMYLRTGPCPTSLDSLCEIYKIFKVTQITCKDIPCEHGGVVE